ncbi:MAG TPA: hypothetical protein QF762_04175 [Acidimicrobiales bacterium]|nr:hypothetical protein [Acidimicrobiales bacterium]|tara:strand:- start:1413 stop:1742 length:330 start_codon:yes stop_codon:yes gene_type:complete
MPWLLLEEKVLSSITTPKQSHHLGQITDEENATEGAELVMSAKLVHTFRKVSQMDAIFLDESFKILKIKTLTSSCIKFSPLKTKAIIKTRKGNASRWGIQVGDLLEVRS